jgi:signal peptidase II
MRKKLYMIIFLILIVDQGSKLLISNIMSIGDNINIVNNFLYITFVKNYGAAWNIFNNQRIFLIILAIGFLVYLYRYIIKNKISTYETISYALLFGGVLGNLIDRVIHGYVIDFIGVYIGNYQFPIFNISDSMIVISVVLFIIDIVRGGEKNENNNS